MSSIEEPHVEGEARELGHEEPTFRPFKRQKHASRQAARSSSPVDERDADAEAALRRARQQKGRAHGIAFTAARADDGTQFSEQQDIKFTLAADDLDVSKRFAPQQGQSTLVSQTDRDPHMLAYVESRLSREQKATADVAVPRASAMSTATRQAASVGKIQEIDLGPSSTERNVQRTQQVRERLAAGLSAVAVPEKRPPRIRKGFGPDGKPWRPRRVRTRPSDELLREKLVEEVLSEAKVSVYAENEVLPHDDDRLAETFTKDYMEQAAQRQRSKLPAPAPVRPDRMTAAEKEKEAKRGPKLGGSRSARAAMREKGAR